LLGDHRNYFLLGTILEFGFRLEVDLLWMRFKIILFLELLPSPEVVEQEELIAELAIAQWVVKGSG
jgi:hypothetical protein